MKDLTKEQENLNKKLVELTEEIASSLVGESRFTPELLSAAIENTKDKIEQNENLLSEKKEQIACRELDIQNLNYYYDQFVGWADEFDKASPERKRMIVCSLFKEITVGKGYDIQILMDSSYADFIN